MSNTLPEIPILSLFSEQFYSRILSMPQVTPILKDIHLAKSKDVFDASLSWRNGLGEEEYAYYEDKVLNENYEFSSIQKDMSPIHAFASSRTKDYYKARVRMDYSRRMNLQGLDAMDVNAKTQNEDTPLHYAMWQGRLEKALFLLASGADPNAQNYKGDTPFHHAFKKDFNDYSKVFGQVLLFNEFKADWLIPNNDGVRPLDLFCEYIKRECSLPSSSSDYIAQNVLKHFKPEIDKYLNDLVAYNIQARGTMAPWEGIAMEGGGSLRDVVTELYLKREVGVSQKSDKKLGNRF